MFYALNPLNCTIRVKHTLFLRANNFSKCGFLNEICVQVYYKMSLKWI